MGHMAKAQATLMVVLVCLTAAGLVYGQESDPCYEAYLESGLSAQQMTYHQFQGVYGKTVCATHLAQHGIAVNNRAGDHKRLLPAGRLCQHPGQGHQRSSNEFTGDTSEFSTAKGVVAG